MSGKPGEDKARTNTLRQKRIWQVLWTGASGDNIMSTGHGLVKKEVRGHLTNKLT